MSVADHALEAGGAPGLRPFWLRPTALAVVLAAHLVVLLLARGAVMAPSPLDSLEVGLVALGDSAEDQKPQEAIKPSDPAPPPPLAQTTELTAPPPQVVAPEAPPLPVAKPKPPPKAKQVVEEEDDRPRPAEIREIQRKKREASERRRQAQEARQAARRGAANGSESGGLSRADYGAQLIAELNSHRFYPAAARAEGATGSVGVRFTVGPNGRVTSQTVTRSSGNAALDSAAHAIMSAINAPPPPGGHYSNSTNIRFHLD